MSFSTGKNCEAVKKILLSREDITNIEIKGEIRFYDDLDDSIQRSLNISGCDWPIMRASGKNIEIYFSCCCKKGSIVVLKAHTMYPDLLKK